MSFKNRVARLERSRKPSADAEHRRRFEARHKVLTAFAEAVEAGRSDRGGELFAAIGPHLDDLLNRGFLRTDATEFDPMPPAAEFAEGLFGNGAVLPHPFPAALVGLLLDPTAVRVGDRGCRGCGVALPEHTGPWSTNKVYPQTKIIAPACPACGAADLGFVAREFGQRLRLFDTAARKHTPFPLPVGPAALCGLHPVSI